jgi:hypothetical protein
MANIRNRPRTVAIEVCLLFNFAVVFDLYLFRFRQVFIDNVLINIGKMRQLGSWFFSLFYNTRCLLTL